MRIVTPPIEINEGESFEQDILERKEYGESLANLVSNSSDELVISIDGRWGEGKSTFVKMWQGLLTNKDIPNIYIDAFANDYVDDAFISITSSITTYINENLSEDDAEKGAEFKEKAKNVGVQLLSWTAKVGVKAATLGAIKDSDIDDLKDIKNDLAKGVSSVVGDFVADRLASHAQDVEIMKSFKALLSEIPSGLSNEGNKPLVIIIDELDRCKPTYAIEIIEKVKHLFSVKNVVFVLVMHRKQLEESVKCVYGQDIDAHTYLQKFINIETALPKRAGDSYVNDISRYCKRLFDLHEIQTWGDQSHLYSSIDMLANYFNLSLRQLEKVFTNIAIYYASSSENQLRITPVIAFVSVIKVVNPKLFNDLSRNNVTLQELVEIIGLTDDVIESMNDSKFKHLMNWVKFTLMNDEEYDQLPADDLIKSCEKTLWQNNIERRRLLPLFISNITLFNVV